MRTLKTYSVSTLQRINYSIINYSHRASSDPQNLLITSGLWMWGLVLWQPLFIHEDETFTTENDRVKYTDRAWGPWWHHWAAQQTRRRICILIFYPVSHWLELCDCHFSFMCLLWAYESILNRPQEYYYAPFTYRGGKAQKAYSKSSHGF